MSRVVDTLSSSWIAARRCRELGPTNHQVIPSAGGWDVLELTPEEVRRARRQHFITRAEQLEASAGVLAIMARVSRISRERLLKQAKEEIARAMKLREQAELVSVEEEDPS